MDKFFDPGNAYSVKLQEIQSKFVDGIGYLLANYPDDETRGKGIAKLWKLKEDYEVQLMATCQHPEQIPDLVVCFMCFDKKDGPCEDCD